MWFFSVQVHVIIVIFQPGKNKHGGQRQRQRGSPCKGEEAANVFNMWRSFRPNEGTQCN